MNTFPVIAEPRYPIKETIIKPAIRSKMDAPYISSRPAWTGVLRKFSLSWDEEIALPEADFQSLAAFFITNQGFPFHWAHTNYPHTIYTVIFGMDELQADILVPGWRICQVELWAPQILQT